jgi:hypothetical protein
MNETFISIVVAMIVPAATVIVIIILERRSVPAEVPIAQIVLFIPLVPELPVPVVTRWQRLRSWLNRRIHG